MALNQTLKKRKKIAEYYIENLKNVEFPRELPNTYNSNFFFLILSEYRDKLNKYLNENGIDTRITYPMPINEQPIFNKFSKEIFPVAKKISKNIIFRRSIFFQKTKKLRQIRQMISENCWNCYLKKVEKGLMFSVIKA